MSRRSFDDGHQNPAHIYRDVISDVARDEGISVDEAAPFVPGAMAEMDAYNLENYDSEKLVDDLEEHSAT